MIPNLIHFRARAIDRYNFMSFTFHRVRSPGSMERDESQANYQKCPAQTKIASTDLMNHIVMPQCCVCSNVPRRVLFDKDGALLQSLSERAVYGLMSAEIPSSAQVYLS